MKNRLIIILTLAMVSAQVLAGPIRVGNGDDGEDLQSFEPVIDGVIADSREKAVKLLKSFNIQKIEGLGALLPEVENTKLYLTKKGLGPEELAKLGAFTADASGLIYARTMPRPYAATRFFPAAKKLNESQLIALHIHEGLHRSLPESIRENEQVASSITQSITAPDASFDSIKATIQGYLPKNQPSSGVSNVSESKLYVPEKSRLRNPSRFGIEARVFQQSDESEKATGNQIESMYILSSHLYPFGKNEQAVGIGFDASIIQTADENFMGPLSVGARYRLYTHRDFDIEGFAQLNMNTLSDEELQDSLLGRDTTTIGLTLSTQRSHFFIENDFFYTFESEVEEQIGNIDYTYTFGEILGINLRAGVHYKNFMFGGFTEFLVSDNFTVEGGDFADSTGRNRIVSWGPHIEYRKNQYSLVMRGRFILNSTDNTSYDYLADLMGYGVGQGSLQTQLNVFF